MRLSTRALVALIGVCALAGCGGGAPARSPAGAAFIDLVPALPASLDPAAEQGAAFDAVETSLAGTLVRPQGSPPTAAMLAPATAVVGFLATSWHELAGGAYVFTLRRGVGSAYGHTLSGADVSFSFARELAHSAFARFLARTGGISLRDPVSVLGGGRVRVNVTAPSPFTLAVLANFRFGVLDSRAVVAHESAADPDAAGWLARHLAFYGPYELTSFEPGHKLLAHANPSFWRPLRFSDLAIEAVPSSSLRLADLGAAAASHTAALRWSDFEIAARTAGLRALTLASGAVSVLVPNERFRPFAAVAVRRALSLAIDRTAIARDAFAGLAVALPPPPATLAGARAAPGPLGAPDTALARSLLAAAGYRHGLSVVFGASVADSPQAPAELAVIAHQLAAIGVRVSVRYASSAAALATLERDGAVDGVLETQVTPVASAAFTILEQYVRGSPGDLERYDSPALDALAGALETTAPAALAQATLARIRLAQARAIVAASFPAIALVDVPAQLVTRAAIGGYAAYPAPTVYYDLLGG
jgi:peptide/nickel transport system substrate-binding protein